MVYECYDCKKKFRHPKIVQEMLGYYGSAPYYEPFAYCPNCGSDDFDEVKGDVDSDDEVIDDDDSVWEEYHAMMDEEEL